MRIVGGTCGGRVLVAPPGAMTRPTSEKVREAMFAILGPLAPTDHVLDLFAGSGGLGLEALSRGAAHATFVDRGKPALAAVKANLAALGLAARATVVAGDAIAIASRHVPPAPWNLVFIDPPYASDLATRAVTVLGALPPAQLAPDATIVIEHDRRYAPPERAGSLLRTDARRYGDTLVSFYRAAEPT